MARRQRVRDGARAPRPCRLRVACALWVHVLMLALLAKVALVRFIKRRIRRVIMRKILEQGGIIALIGGVVQLVSGVDVAPADIDKVVSAIAVLAIYGPKIYDGLKARF